MSNSCFWILGRGASIANGLRWRVRRDWYAALRSRRTTRDEMIDRIRRTIRDEMDQPDVHNNAYRRLIEKLSRRTSKDWYHRFLTTNWDTLLEQELFPIVEAEGVVPAWLGQQSHIFHLNGTIEEGNDEHRSPFLLETDDASERVQTLEANKAYNQLLTSKCAVVVGMSFECRTDRNFLDVLNRDEDVMPIGESAVYIINPEKSALDKVCDRIRSALPNSTMVPIEKSFDVWIDDGLSDLVGTALMR